MRLVLSLATLLLFIQTFSQEKSMLFYNENKEEMTEVEFHKSIDYTKNLDLYFENDSLQIGLLTTRQKFGKLDKKMFNKLKAYLINLSQKPLDSTQNIVINYLSPIPKKQKNSNKKSSWNIFKKFYLKKLHKIANISQFWICSPESNNLNYYHHDKINWVNDEEDFFKKQFFKYDIKYGNYLLIKPNGDFYYYLGEYGQSHVLESAEKYFR